MTRLAGRSGAYAVVAVLAVVDFAASALTLSASLELAGLETTLIAAVFGVTALLASGVAFWLALRAPSREDLLGLAVGLTGIPLGGNLIFHSFRWFTDDAVLAAGSLAVADVAIIFGAAGLLRFFALFPRPVDAEAVRVMYADQLSWKKGTKDEQKLEKEIAKSIRMVEWLQGAKVWRSVGLVGAMFLGVTLIMALATGKSALLSILLGVPALVSVGWGAPVAVVLSNAAFKTSSGEDRSRLLWIHWGLTAAVFAFLTFGALLGLGIIVGFDSTALVAALLIALSSPPFCFLCGLVVAVFYEGSVDPSLAIHRTTVYGALGVLFVFFFAAFGNVASEFVEARLGLPGVVGTGLYGGTVAVLLLPLRGRFSRVSERWVPSLEVDEAADS